ncbi:MAG: hypothetical protein OFPI_10240 [Osedax symbiont Rs2]|nr:MAG: hypothetical protein OFPI_10240 [Osedax symbiont Rs2]
MISKQHLHLLRHGQTTAGKAYIGSTDVPLTDLGWQQMRSSVEKHLASGATWDLVLSSPLQRCANFARELSVEQQLPVEIVANLAEYHFGDWEAKTALQVMEQYPNALESFWSDPQNNPPANAESLLAFSQRIDAVIQQIRQKHPGKKVLVICHGGVMRYLLSAQQNLPLSAMLNFPVEHGELVSINS